MSILSAIKDYLTTYGSSAGLLSGALLGVDFLGPTPTGYALISQPGTRIIEKYLNGGSTREFPFAFQAAFSTADEAARLDNIDFYEDLAEWFDTQTEAGVLPTLTGSKTAEKIEAVGWGFVYEQGQSSTGIYQLTCKLTYSQT